MKGDSKLYRENKKASQRLIIGCKSVQKGGLIFCTAHRVNNLSKSKEVFTMTTNKNWFANLIAEHSKPRTGKNVLKEARAAVDESDWNKIDELKREVSDVIAENIVSGNEEKIAYWKKIEKKFYDMVYEI
jgi:hypothetical protein